MAERLRARCQLDGWLTTARFETFTSTAENRDALKDAKHYATLASRGWLTLYGGYGTGKTHLLAAIVNYAVGNYVNAVYFTLPDLAARLRSECGEDGNLDRLVNDVCCIDLLAIDEVDPAKLNVTPFVEEQFYRIFDSRYRDIHLRTTVFACQYEPAPAESPIMGYLYSRMQDARNRMHSMGAADARPRQEAN